MKNNLSKEDIIVAQNTILKQYINGTLTIKTERDGWCLVENLSTKQLMSELARIQNDDPYFWLLRKLLTKKLNKV